MNDSKRRTENLVNTNDRSIVGLVMVGHAMVHTYELSIPILVTVWLLEFGTTEAVIGVIVTIGYGLFGLGALPSGLLADRIGSHRMIVVCLSGMATSFLLLGLSPGLPVIALALLVWGVAASIYHPAGLTLISKGVEERGTAFAYHGMAGNVGIAFGPLVTLLLLEVLQWRTVAMLLAIPAFVGALYALTVDVDESAAVTAADGGETSDDSKTSTDIDTVGEFLAESRGLLVGSFLGIFGIVILSGLYYRGILTFLPDILGGFTVFDPISVAGIEFEPDRYVYVGLLTVGIAGQYIGGKLSDRIRPEKGIIVGTGALAVLAIVFLPAAELGVAPFLLVCGLLGLFLFMVQPLYQASVADFTPPGKRGLSYGYTYLGVFGVGSLGGAVAGVILTYGSAAGLFTALALIGLTAAGIATVLTIRGRPGPV